MIDRKRVLLWAALAAVIWVAASFLPSSWRAGGSAFPVIGPVGMLAVYKYDEAKKKREVKLEIKRADYIGAGLLLVVAVALWRGADALALARLLAGKP